jgi:hypothetical protein
VFKHTVKRYETGNKRKREITQEDRSRAADDRSLERSFETTGFINLRPEHQSFSSIKSQGAVDFHSVKDVGQSQARIASHVETNVMSGPLIAKMAHADKLQSVLGYYLFGGMISSHSRRSEDSGLARLTDAVRLHFASQLSEDFILEIWLDSLAGKAIQEAKEKSIEDLKAFLGDYLFEGMETCNRRKEEEERGLSAGTGAVNVHFPDPRDSSDDTKLEVLLNFEMGREIYEKVYPRGPAIR